MDPFTMIALAGAGTSLLQGFMGAEGAEDAASAQAGRIQQGVQQYNAYADQGKGYINTSTDKSLGYVQPFVDAGTDGLKLYKDAIGVNGRPAQQTYFDEFQNDPGFNAALAQGEKQVQQSAIYKGRGDSGATQKELFSYGQNQQYGAFQDRLNRLSSLSSIGLDAGKTASGIETGRGSQLANIALGQGQTAFNGALGIGTAEAGGISGSTNAINGAIGGLGSSLAVYGIGSGVKSKDNPDGYSNAQGLAAMGTMFGRGNANTPTTANNRLF